MGVWLVEARKRTGLVNLAISRMLGCRGLAGIRVQVDHGWVRESISIIW